MPHKLEYVWLDGYETQNLRSKIKVVDEAPHFLKFVNEWNFDGSSTEQATGRKSDCILKPVRIYPFDQNKTIVLCEVFNPDGTPHQTNTRSKLRELQDKMDSSGFWWGFEQEYFITKNFTPVGFPDGGYPRPQGLYYCGVGGNQIKARGLVEKHLDLCLSLGIQLTGINAEVAPGQWEYQCFAKDTLKACDDLWISRYMLYLMAESEGLDIDISPKPIRGDWNGSGCHTNFSTSQMRDVGGQEHFESIFKCFSEHHWDHIQNYGKGNEARLTGRHETQSIDKFSWGISDRGSSIRVPIDTGREWKGYVEDRRPASNCDPYSVSLCIVKSTLNLW